MRDGGFYFYSVFFQSNVTATKKNLLFHNYYIQQKEILQKTDRRRTKGISRRTAKEMRRETYRRHKRLKAYHRPRNYLRAATRFERLDEFLIGLPLTTELFFKSPNFLPMTITIYLRLFTLPAKRIVDTLELGSEDGDFEG